MTPTKFLNELKSHDKEKYIIVKQLRSVILETCKADEEIKYGGLLYSKNKPFTGLFVSKAHVSMEFSEGAQFDDNKKLLQGIGKHRRHLKFTSASEINKTVVKNFLIQALKLQK